MKPGYWLVIALLLIGLAWALGRRYRLLTRLFGPPSVHPVEAYEKNPSGAVFDHSMLDALLKEHVRKNGRVDYRSLGREAKQLDAYLDSLDRAKLPDMGRDEVLALLINAYNACTLRLILDYLPLSSIRDIPADLRWDDRRWSMGGLTLSLTEIENEYLRARFREPRIHFAINCASIGCPPLRAEAYVGARIDAQLEEQALLMHRDERWFRLDGDSLSLTQLYDWYRGDFQQAAGSVLGYAERFSPELREARAAGSEPTIRWLPYDWKLNAAKE